MKKFWFLYLILFNFFALNAKEIVIDIDAFEGTTEQKINLAIQSGLAHRNSKAQTIVLQFANKNYTLECTKQSKIQLKEIYNLIFRGVENTQIVINEQSYIDFENYDFMQDRSFLLFFRCKKIMFESIEFRGSNLLIKDKNYLDVIYSNFNFENCEDITFEKCRFNDFLFTTLKFNNCNRIKALSNNFNNVGQTTFFNNNNSYYSYDCILFLGNSTELEIMNNSFVSIGSNYTPMTLDGNIFRNDGDCVHIFSGKQITIAHNYFENWAARAIKIQSGSNIKIHNNNAYFIPIKTKFPEALIGSFIDVAMVAEVKKVIVKDNYISKVHTFFTSDNATSNKYVLKDVTIEKNKVDSCYYGFRIEGNSMVNKVAIDSNHFISYHQVLSNQNVQGSTLNLRFRNNLISAISKDWPISLYSANNVFICSNVFDMRNLGGSIRLHNVAIRPDGFNNVKLEDNLMNYSGIAIERYNFLARDGSDNMYSTPKKVKIKKNRVQLRDKSIVKMEDSKK